MAAAALALAGAWPAWSQARTLDFAQAVEVALHQNPDLRAVQAQLAQARAGVAQAHGARLPRLSAGLGATRTDDALNAFGLKLAQRGATFNDFGAGQFNPAQPGVLGVAPNNLNYPGAVNDFSSRLQAQLPLYTGGKLDGYLRQAHAMLLAAQAGDRAARQEIIDHVLQAYDGVYTARAYQEVAAKALQAAQSQLRMVDNLYRQGVVLKSDLLAAKVNLENVRMQQQQAADLEAQAMDGLHVVLGMPLDQPIELGPPVRVSMPGGSPGGWIVSAQAGNPRLVALSEQVAAAGGKVEVARSDLYPQVGAMARVETHDPNLGFSAHSYTVGVQLNWDIFDGGVTRDAIDEAAAAQDALRLKLQSAREQLGMQIQDVYRKARLAAGQIAGRELAVQQAEEAQRIVEQRYSNGVGTLLELQGAQAMLDKARADLVLARSQVTTQRAALRLALGRLDVDSVQAR